MALNMPNASDDFASALRNNAPAFTGSDSELTQLLLKATIGFRVVTASIDDVANGKSLQAALDGAKATVWRFLSQGEAGIFAAGEVSNAKPGAPSLVNVSSDPRLAEILRAVEQVKGVSEVNEDDYEVRLLRIPGVLVEALWLESRTGKPGFIVPVLSAAKELEVGRVYRVEEFISIVGTLSERFRKFDETPYRRVARDV